MKVTLNIQEDVELRAAIKEAIVGQVLAVTREEITAIVREEIGKKIRNSDVQYLNRLIGESMQKVLEGILYEKYEVDTWRTAWIEPAITKYLDMKVGNALKGRNWDGVVEALAKQKIKDMIK